MKLSAPYFAEHIADLVNNSLNQAFVPIQWKQSTIKPVPKIPQPITPSDFRPISLTSVLSRLTERLVISNYIYPAFSYPTPGLTLKNQFAFCPTGSTTVVLINLLHIVTELLNSNQYVRVITIDCKKAFDTVRHSELIHKLNKLNISSNICNWITRFHSERNHGTLFKNQHSSFKHIHESVVQGSALGSTMFAIISSDLKPLSEHNHLIKYPDNTYFIILSSNSHTIETELNNIIDWALVNNLKLNKNKSKEIVFHIPKSNKRHQIPSEIKDVERVTELKCLGVTLTSNFSFSPHISLIISSCSRNLFALHTLRSKGLSNSLLNTVFQSTTLNKLLYASQSWWGFLNTNEKERLEAHLRRATKAGFYTNNNSFDELCLSADIKLFNTIEADPNHLLATLLPPVTKHQYSTRINVAGKNYDLPAKRLALTDRNFIPRMIHQ